MKEITLYCGRVTLISDIDYDRVIQHRWRANEHTASGKPYVCTTLVLPEGRKTTVYLHRFITGCPAVYRVDHKDRDTLNNQRFNLRITNFEDNNLNRCGWSLSGYKGVSRSGRRWRARITQEGEYKHLGMFDTAIGAAMAYDEAAFDRFGEFAFLNFPENYPLPDYDLHDVPF